MREFGAIFIRAVLIAVAASLLGLGVNLVSPKGVPWIYVRPDKIEVDGVTIPIISEEKALGFLDDGQTIFLDTRNSEDYAESHIKGAISLPDTKKEERFPVVESLLPKDERIILYCTGPECHMAENVAVFLAKLGFQNLMLMPGGIEGWEKAGHPLESGQR